MRSRTHRSIRSWLALTAAAAAAASGLAVLSAGSAGASVTDAIVVLPNSGTAITDVIEGNSTGGPPPTKPQKAKAPRTKAALTGSNLVGTFTDIVDRPSGQLCDTEFLQATIYWGDTTTSLGSIRCEQLENGKASGVFDVFGVHIYADSGPYNISLVVRDTEESESSGAPVQTDTASISDATLGVDFDNSDAAGAYTKVEGQSLTVGVAFFDNNNAFPNEGAAFDPSLMATINWGDGSAIQSVTPVAPPSSCDCAGDFLVTATHLFDGKAGAAPTYGITVTAKDDGGQTATDTFTATVTDAKLTAGASKSFAATATKGTTAVVANFSDASTQAAAADYAASIKWGDNTTSAGTLSKAADGTFNVSGTHTYASAGNRTLSITVTDEEGQTFTVAAAATVGAAPVILPLTGHPTAPVAPGLPLPLLGIALGLLAIAFGTGQLLLRRLRS